MSNTKMVVVVRRDLNMPPGLLAAQAMHIGMEFIRRKSWTPKKGEAEHIVSFNKVETEWFAQPYVSVLAVNTPEELDFVYKSAKNERLHAVEWLDVIPSEVLSGQVLECRVGISIGPADSDALRKVTGTLPLY